MRFPKRDKQKSPVSHGKGLFCLIFSGLLSRDEKY